MENAIKWSPKYSVGIEEIDKQHEFLFNLVSELYDNRDSTGDTLALFLKDFLTRISNYVVFHFETEEIYMDAVKYDKKEHVIDHRDFLYVVFDVVKEYNKTKSIDMVSIANYLNKWLVEHIGDKDKRFGEFYLKQKSDIWML